MSEIQDEWPLYEIFVRGKRGLNHVHVGSLHAADDEMALRHARDVYTRRNEGVSIWAVRSDAVTAIAARTRRTRCSPRAATRSTGTRPSTPSPTTSPTCDGLTDVHDSVYDDDGSSAATPRTGPSAPPTSRRGPARRRGHDDPRGRRPRRAGGVLPDARRRRPGLLPPPLRVVQPRARPRGGHRAGQHRARPARPGQAAAGARPRPPRPPSCRRCREGSPVPPEDALAFFRDDAGFRNVRLVEPDNGDFA